MNEPNEPARHAPEDIDLDGIDLKDYEDPDLDDVDGPDPDEDDRAASDDVNRHDPDDRATEEPGADEPAIAGSGVEDAEDTAVLDTDERPEAHVAEDAPEDEAIGATDSDTAVAVVNNSEAAVVRTPGYGLAQPDGSVEGYRAKNTLPLRVELARQLRRRRTWLTLCFLLLLPLLLVGAFQLGDEGPSGGRSYADIATSSGLNFAVFTLYASTSFLLVVVVALFFGDMIASEASWSSLKYLLSAPIPRLRLLRQKAKVSAFLSVLALVLLTGTALAVGIFWFGTGPLVSPTGESLSFLRGIVMVVAAAMYLAVHLSWVAALAMWLSVSTDAPLGAVGGAVLVSILSQILDQISALGELRRYLPTHFATAYADLFGRDIDFGEMINGCFSALSFAAVFVTLALWRFHRKDITS